MTSNKNTQETIMDAEPSFIEFFASVFKDNRLRLLAIFRICNALYREMAPAAARTIIVKGCLISFG